MSKSTFKFIQDKIFPLESKMGYGFQIRGDHHKGVVNVAYDENSGPNAIAGLSYINKPKNYFSFVIKSEVVQQAHISKAAQAVVAEKLLTELKGDVQKNNRENVILYPSSGNEKNVAWMMEAMQMNAAELGATIASQEVQIDKTHKVPGIVLTFA